MPVGMICSYFSCASVDLFVLIQNKLLYALLQMKMHWKKHCLGCSSYTLACSLNLGSRSSHISWFLSFIPGKKYDRINYRSFASTLVISD
jgi:hypothetical protein